MIVKKAEKRRCPAEFQDRITRRFGKNQFGDPIFKIEWGQSLFIRQGNVWRDESGNERFGYIERYSCAGMACWVILRWHAPFEYGSPAAYYMNTWMPVNTNRQGMAQDKETPQGYYVTGEYPWKGRYEVVQPLISKEMVGNELVVTHFPLTHYLIDVLIPMIENFRRLSKEEQEAARAVARAMEEKQQTEFIADILEENMPTWWGPVSYSGRGIKTSYLDRKMAAIQRVWDREASKPQFSRGMSQGNAPRRIR